MTAVHATAPESTDAASGPSIGAFTVSQTYDAALGVLLKAVLSTTTVPILANVLLEYNGKGSLRAMTTDLETTVAIVFPVQSESAPFKVTIPAKQFVDFLKGSKTGYTLESFGGGNVELSTGGKRITVPALPASEFPPTVVKRPEEPKASFASPLARMQNVLATATKFASTEEARGAVLMSVCIDTKNARIAATDGYVLVHDDLPGVISTTPAKDWEELIVPRGASGALCAIKIPKGVETSKVIADAYMNGRERLMFRATVGDVRYTIVTRLVDGQYPNYRQVVPTGYERSFRVNRKALLDVVKAAGKVAGNLAKMILLESAYDDGTLTVSASSSELGKFSSDLRIENVRGTTYFAQAFNAEYLANKVLRAFDTDEVELRYLAPENPLVVVAEGTARSAVIMPLRR